MSAVRSLSYNYAGAVRLACFYCPLSIHPLAYPSPRPNDPPDDLPTASLLATGPAGAPPSSPAGHLSPVRYLREHGRAEELTPTGIQATTDHALDGVQL